MTSDEPLHDAHLRKALRHAPDVDVQPSAALDAEVLRAARAASMRSVPKAPDSPPARSGRPRAAWQAVLGALDRWRAPAPAAALGTLALGTVIVALWWPGPPAQEASPAEGTADATADAPAAGASTGASPTLEPIGSAAPIGAPVRGPAAPAPHPPAAPARPKAAAPDPAPPERTVAPSTPPAADGPSAATASRVLAQASPAPAPRAPTPPDVATDAATEAAKAGPAPRLDTRLDTHPDTPPDALRSAAPSVTRARAAAAAAPEESTRPPSPWRSADRGEAPRGGVPWPHPLDGRPGRLQVVDPAAAPVTSALAPAPAIVWWVPESGPAWRREVPAEQARAWREGRAAHPWPPGRVTAPPPEVSAPPLDAPASAAASTPR